MILSGGTILIRTGLLPTKTAGRFYNIERQGVSVQYLQKGKHPL